MTPPSPAQPQREAAVAAPEAPLPGSAGDTSPGWARDVELGNGVRIRQAWPVEYPEIEDLLVTAFTTGCWVAADYKRGLRKLAERSQRFHIWVAAGPERILGVVLTPRLEHWDQDFFSFSILAVHPAGRGQRLGEALVAHCLGLARTHGFARVEIHSSPQMSEAHRLYYRLGFVRHIEDEVIFVGEHEERLLTLSYRLLDPLGPGEAVSVAPAAHPLPPGGGPFAHTPDRSSWPAPPPGSFDRSGNFLPLAPRQGLTAEHTAAIANALPHSGPGRSSSPSAGPGDQADGELAARIAADLSAGAVTVLYSPAAKTALAATRVFFARLDLLDASLQQRRFLHGNDPGADDAYLAALLLGYDFGWRAGFGPVAGAVANFPRLWDHARQLLALTGTRDLVPPDAASGPWGAIPPVAASLPELRAGWLEPVPAEGSTERELPTGARPTPYSDAWPAPDLAASELEKLSELTAEAERAAGGEASGREAIRAVWQDLHQGIARLAQGCDALTQQALRRVFFARLSWLEARLASQDWLSGDSPGELDAIVFRLLGAFEAGLREAFPPIDPRLADYPLLNRRAQLYPAP